MNSKQIDEIAVSYLNITLAKCKLLMPDINTNDKTPVWDGEIQLFGNIEHTRDWIRKIPIQVKGTTIGDLSNSKIAHSVKKSNLENFSANGGVMFFVILINDDGHKIFYKRLLPQDIQPIIKEMSESKKYRAKDPKKSIDFLLFPTNEKEIIQLMNHFLQNTTKNRHIYSMYELASYNDFTITHSGINSGNVDPRNISEIAKYLNDGNTYRYIVPKELPNEKLPLERDDNVLIYIEENLPSKVDGISFSRIANRDNVYCYIGSNTNAFERSIVLNEKTYELKINLKGTINQQISDIFYILSNDLFKSLPNENKNIMAERFEYLTSIKHALEQCGLSSDIEFSKLNEEERIQLYKLSKTMSEEFVDSESFKGENKLFRIFDVLDKQILLCKKYISEKRFVWKNPFTDFPRIWVAELGADGNIQVDKAVAISAFMTYNKNVYTLYANTNYDNIFAALIESDSSTFAIEHLALKTQCDLIHAYDMDTENTAVLEIALKYGDWLDKNTNLDKDCLLINRLQILKRRDGSVPTPIYEELIKLTNSKNSSIQFAAYTLLENKLKALECLKNVDADHEESLLSSPIYYLFKLLNNINT